MRTRFTTVFAIGPLLAGCLFMGACSHTVRNYDQSMVPAPSEAVKEVSKADVSRSLARVADSLRESGDYKTAVSVYARAMVADPKDASIPLGLAQSFWALGDWEDAGRAFEQAQTLDPKNPEARIGVANSLLATGRLDEAIKQFQALIADMPHEPRVYSGLGVAYDLQGNHSQAQLYYGMGLEVAPGNTATKNNLAVSFALEHDFATAIELLKGMPDTPKTRQNLALVYGLANKPAEAEKMARMDLDEQAVRNNLEYYAWLRGLKGRDQAEAVLLGHSTDAAKAIAQNDAPTVADAAPTPPAVPPIPADVAPLSAPEAAMPKSVLLKVPAPVESTDRKDVHAQATPKAVEKPETDSELTPEPANSPDPADASGSDSADSTNVATTGEQPADEAPAPVAQAPAPEMVAVTAPPRPQIIDIAQADPASVQQPAAEQTEKAAPGIEKTGAQKLYQVQFASFRTLQETEGAKKKLVRLHGDLLRGVDLVIEQADLGPSKGSYHRLRTAPVADKDGPQDLCRALKATGTACFVTNANGIAPTSTDHPQG